MHELTLRNGVLTHRDAAARNGADATITVPRGELDMLLVGSTTLEALLGDGTMTIEGDAAKLVELLGFLEAPDPAFPIVTP